MSSTGSVRYQKRDRHLMIMFHFLTSRSGRIRPIANANGEEIAFLPIVRDVSGAAPCWPEHGPNLEPLVAYTEAFFDRKVRLLPPAILNTNGAKRSSGGHNRRRSGTSSAATRWKFPLRFPRGDGSMSDVHVMCRYDRNSSRVQVEVTSLWEDLAGFRLGRLAGMELSDMGQGNDTNMKNFCIVGITMEDLYDGPRDLFCAGMAFGGSKGAVFSLSRYRPHLQMHPLHWYHYGYDTTWGSHPYFDDKNQNPIGLKMEAPSFDEMIKETQAEFLCRSTKLLTPEIGHLYGLDHCIFNRCLMMGTGHLVEDFVAPSHVCGICLRKLQWRLGFKVRQRYQLLGRAFRTVGMRKEATWVEKQVQKAQNSKTIRPKVPK